MGAVKKFGEKMQARDAGISEATVAAFGQNMFGGEFVLSVSRDFVKGCRTPLFLQPGIDLPHPPQISAEIAALAPDVEVMAPWKAKEHIPEAIRRVRAFLARHTP